MIERNEFLGMRWSSAITTARRSRFSSRPPAGQRRLLDIDVQGERQVKRRMPDSVSIFVLRPAASNWVAPAQTQYQRQRALRRDHSAAASIPPPEIETIRTTTTSS